MRKNTMQQALNFIYSRFMNRTNPYWVLAEQVHNIRRDRIFGNLSAKYNLFPWLFVQARVGQDYYSRDEDVNNFPTGHASRAAAPAGFVNGVFYTGTKTFQGNEYRLPGKCESVILEK
jgi:hypothetical protein